VPKPSHEKEKTMRANPNSLCTKWVAISDAMTDEEHAAEDARVAAAKPIAKNETEAERKTRHRKMDTATYVGSRGNAGFSIFADTSRDPR
jgi:hypothetical protein